VILLDTSVRAAAEEGGGEEGEVEMRMRRGEEEGEGEE